MIDCSKSNLFWFRQVQTRSTENMFSCDAFESHHQLRFIWEGLHWNSTKLDLLLRMSVWLQFVRVMHSHSRGHWYYKIDICPELQVIILHKASPVVYWFCLMQFTQNEVLTLSVSTIKCSSEFHWFNSDNFRTSEKLFMCWAWENISNIFY